MSENNNEFKVISDVHFFNKHAYDTCAKNLEKCRRAKNLSQEELAKIIECSSDVIMNIEQGINVFDYPVKIFIKLADFFGYKLYHFMFNDHIDPRLSYRMSIDGKTDF